jgi:hypothetical protein
VKLGDLLSEGEFSFLGVFCIFIFRALQIAKVVSRPTTRPNVCSERAPINQPQRSQSAFLQTMYSSVSFGEESMVEVESGTIYLFGIESSLIR